MRTAVDSSVLLDVVLDSPDHADASEQALRQATREGQLIICECVLAEIRPAFDEAAIKEFLDDWKLHFVASSQESAVLAGGMFATHLQRGGKPKRVVVDFLIGAHAMYHADRLLARDRGFYRDYFSQLKMIEP